jgi:response regulator RpfG family c-di-GMP phosphodiesterase
MDTRSSPPFLPCLYFISSLAIAADGTPATEEIIVEADRSKINLKLQVDQAENEFYAILNELIDDEEFKIECRTQRVIGSLIHKRICQTKYMKDELTNSAQLYQVGVNYLADEVLKKKNRELRQKTIELLETNPKLLRAARKLSDRVEEYQDEYGIEVDRE